MVRGCETEEHEDMQGYRRSLPRIREVADEMRYSTCIGVSTSSILLESSLHVALQPTYITATTERHVTGIIYVMQ